MIEYIVIGALGWLAIYVVGILGIAALRGHVSEIYVPSVDYADDFTAKLSGSARERGPQASSPEIDPGIVFATATPSPRRRTGLAAAHAQHSRKEATSTSYAFNETTEHATTAAASHPYSTP